MELSEIVEKIINGSIDEYSLLMLAKERKLLEVYEGKTIIDYILEYKRKTKEFDKFSVYNSEIAIKYLDYGLSPNIDSEEIFMSKYDEEKTIFERHIENHFGAPFLNIISNLIKDGRTLKEILLCKIDNKYVFEHLEEKGLNTIITYMMVANDEKALELIEKHDVLLFYIYDKEIFKEEINGQTILSRLLRMNISDEDLVKKILEESKYSLYCSDFWNKNQVQNSNLVNSIWYKLLDLSYFGNFCIPLLQPISATLNILDLVMISNLYKEALIHSVEFVFPETRDIVLYCVRYEKWEILSHASAEVLTMSVDGKSLLDWLYDKFVNNEIYPLEMRKKFIEKLRKIVTGENKNSVFLAKISFKYGDFATTLKNVPFLLEKDKVSGDTYLDIIIKELVESNNIEHICSIKYTSRLLTYKSKYLENKMIIEYILDNKLSKGKVKSKVYACIKREKLKNEEAIMLLSIFIKKLATAKDMEKILNEFPEEVLLHKSDVESGGDTNLDIIIKRLLESNNIKQICSIKYTSRLLTHKSKYLENKMIIEYILDNFKEEFKKTSITSNILLYIFDEGMTLLEFLIKKYRDFVIEWSKDNPLFTNIAINSILRVNGIDTIKFNFGFDEEYSVQYIDSHLKSRFEEKCDKEIPEEASAMIEKFRNLMSEDSNDKGIIELACASFKRQFANGFEYAYRDLQTMIELGEEKRLYYKKGYKSEFARRYFFNILIDTIVSIRSYYTISAFDHEMTHALHWFYNTFEIPAFFERFSHLTSQQTNKIGSFIASFHRKLDTYEMQFINALNVDTKDLFLPHYTSFESMVKSSLLEAQKEVEIPPDYLSNKILSESQYKVLFQKETEKEISSRVSREEYDVEMALENMFDALSNGDFLTNGIEFNEENIKLKIGHGIEYFKTTHPFIEVIACYGQIIKSPRKEMGLAILKDVMGQEFIDMLDEFYANMYLPDLDYKMEGESYGL